MAVVKNNYAKGTTTTSTSTTVTASISSVSGDKMIALISWRASVSGVASVSSVIYDPGGLNESLSAVVAGEYPGISGYFGYALYYLDNPTASGVAKDIVVTTNLSLYLRVGIYDLSNAKSGTITYSESQISESTSHNDAISVEDGSVTLSLIGFGSDTGYTILSSGLQTRDMYDSTSSCPCAFGSHIETSVGTAIHSWSWSTGLSGGMILCTIETTVHQDNISNTGFTSTFNSLSGNVAYQDSFSNTGFTSTFDALSGLLAYIDTISNIGFNSIFNNLSDSKGTTDTLANKNFNLTCNNLNGNISYLDVVSNVSFTSSFNTLAIKRTYLDTISNISFNAQFDTISGTRVRQYIIVERLGYPIGTVSSPGIYVTPL